MYKLFMALRYLRSHKIIYFSIAGVAVGIMVMIVVISVMGGFSRDMRARVKGMQAHLVVRGVSQDIYIRDYDALVRKIADLPQVVGCAPRLEYMAWLGRRGGRKTVTFVGIDPRREAKTSKIQNYFLRGGKRKFDFEPDGGAKRDHPGVVLGSVLAFPGEALTTLSTFREATRPVFCEETFEVVGSFDSGMAEYDSTLLFMSLEEAQRYLKLTAPDQKPVVNYLAIQVDDYEKNIEGIRTRVLDLLHEEEPCLNAANHARGRCGRYLTQTWEEAKSILLQAVDIEKGIQIIVMFFIVIVAGFNIIAIYTLVVRSKTREIGILRALGATEGGVTVVFLVSGMLCGLLGCLFGIGAGLLVAVNANVVADTIRIVSREVNGMPRGSIVGALAIWLLVIVFFFQTWRRLYHPWQRSNVVWLVLTAFLLSGAAYATLAWIDGDDHRYAPLTRYDPPLSPAVRLWIPLMVGGSLLALGIVWRRLERFRMSGGWLLFGFLATVVFSLHALLIAVAVAIGSAILALHPPPFWRGLELFSSQVYYLDRIPVFVDYRAIALIVAVTLIVSLVFSIYPALRAALANPIEALRDE